jgi:hypothetical protein
MYYFKVNKYLFWQEKFEDTKGQTTIYKILYRKLKIEQHKPH